MANNNRDSLNYIQGMLDNIALMLNGTKQIFSYDCEIGIINYQTDKTFEENLKNHIINLSKNYTIIPSDFDRKYHNDWRFEMIYNKNPYISFRNFFSRLIANGSSYFDCDFISKDLYEKFENSFGKIIRAEEGFISPSFEYNFYSQHWNHLYLKTQEYHLLITYEINS